ncbi:copper resistance protein NlpE [Apibacter muscae]|uniref:copper resistance protein NlpE n=1 Tax=Apibacter muscae TaxID=2509004 RepID=UPI0011ABD95A|nr:copper resistance protein NlpE [Apibacter muscae]TWP28034.1 copper resistance protein NlpE [Apibacter muscae]
MLKKIFILSLFSLTLLNCTKRNSETLVSKENSNSIDSIKVNNNESPIIDNSTPQNSLDYLGIYEGIIPCADCEGIKVTVELKEGNQFIFTSDYLGEKDKSKPTVIEGNYTWNNNGTIITIVQNSTKQSFKVQEDRLVWLDQEGNEITGDISAHYILKKQ